MKYLIRIIAILPALSVGLTACILFAFAFDYHWLMLPCITNLVAFIILLDKYEETVKDLVKFIQVLCNKTPIYKQS